MVDLGLVSENLQKGRAKDVEALVAQALSENIGARDILEKGLMAGMSIVGVRFKNNEVFVPEVLIAARAMNAGMRVLKPALVSAGVEARGTVVLGTVKGDLHDIGKNLVGMMMEGAGLRVVDLGTDVAAERFVEAAKAEKANVIACSALLTTTMTQMKNVVQAAEAAGIRGSVKIMVGGAPVTDSFCASIGADKYSADAATAAEVAASFCLA
ncbi:MAG: 5-methyltetrahydrofolate--homocysteine methyltransferase [Treponema sp. GWB1_62_6]|nr:MAG: 5-methyltetrahydrofolate--homocysteine methyltransferase [Treponema sp. GWB1_62_6]OHE69417.1 MAG: 5-methyltetrahydrofolate--homocysteine methyltransferase [Treponema sp. RIFOXYC1_FULL_61_9]